MAGFRVFPALGLVLALSFGGCAMVVRTGWAWMLLLTAAQILSAEHFILGALPVFALWLLVPMPWLEAPLQAYGLYLLGLLAYSSFSVNWHRHILLGEKPELRHVLRFDAPVWRVLLTLFPLAAASLAVELAARLLAGQFTFLAELHWGVVLLLQLAPMGIWLMLLHRMAVILPGVALGRERLTYATALRESGGHPVRLAAFMLLVWTCVHLGILAIGQPLIELVPLFMGKGPLMLIIATMLLLMTWFAFVLTATCHAVLYAILVEKREV